MGVPAVKIGQLGLTPPRCVPRFVKATLIHPAVVQGQLTSRPVLQCLIRPEAHDPGDSLECGV